MWCARNEVKCVVGYFQRSSINWSRFFLLLEDVEDVASPMAVNQLMIMPSLTLVKIQVGFEKVSLGRSVKKHEKASLTRSVKRYSYNNLLVKCQLTL